jgi:sporulation protein YlmC with PRC-barrel domain
MKLKLTPIAGALASALILGVASPGAAQTTANQASQSNSAGATTKATSNAGSAAASQQATMMDMRASRLMGKDVRNAQGKELGEINDLVADLSGNRIHYVILSHGGLMGLGDKEVAVPVNQLRHGSRDGQLVLNLTEQQLKDAPALERSAQWNDPRTWDNVGQYYTRTLGMAPSDRPAAAAAQSSSASASSTARDGSGATALASARFQRASQIIGMDVIDQTGDEVGEIEDLVINLSNGSIHYAVLEFDRAWNPVDKLVALPLSSLQPKAGSNDLTIGMTREQLASAPSFEAQKWPDLNDRQFRDRVAGFGRNTTTGMESTPGIMAIVIIDDPQFVRLDTDRDGRLSREEARAFTHLTDQWRVVDRNSDGFLTRDELNSYPRDARTSGAGSSMSGDPKAAGSTDAGATANASQTTGSDSKSR